MHYGKLLKKNITADVVTSGVNVNKYHVIIDQDIMMEAIIYYDKSLSMHTDDRKSGGNKVEY